MSQQPPPPGMQPDGQPPDLSAANYYPDEPNPHLNHLTGGLPINLDSLRDGPPGSKPFYPYSTLIRYAIKGSPNQKLLLEDIYYAIESRFPYFRTAPNGWKNSVRHNLSLNPCFEKVPRPLTDRGKGSYWTVNDNVDPRTGVHRIRKKKPKGAKRNSEEADVDYHTADGSYDDGQFVQHPDDAGSSRAFPGFGAPNTFDQQASFPMMMPGMPYARPPQMPFIAPQVAMEEGLELDEHGNVNWRLAWAKELGHLQQVTAEQDKAQVEQEWYRMMLFRVRAALMAPLNPGEHVPAGPPHGMPPPQPQSGDGQQQ